MYAKRDLMKHREVKLKKKNLFGKLGKSKSKIFPGKIISKSIFCVCLKQQAKIILAGNTNFLNEAEVHKRLFKFSPPFNTLNDVMKVQFLLS